MDDDPAALGRVVLIELHAVGFVDLPVELIYENALSCLEVIDQKLPVLMHVLKREARGAHMLCPLDLSVGTDQGSFLLAAADSIAERFAVGGQFGKYRCRRSCV